VNFLIAQLFGILIGPVFLETGDIVLVVCFSQPRLIDKGKLFSPNPRSRIGFCREKNSKNSGWGGQNFGQLVEPVTIDLRDHRHLSVLPQ
jgi:hypothetical protein